MKKTRILLLLCVAAMTGCVGQAGIGADGAVTAERETSIYRYTTTGPDGRITTAEALVAKKARVEGLHFDRRADGRVVMDIEVAESGDRLGDKALETANRSLAMMEHITGAGGRGTRLAMQEDRRTATAKRDEARAEQRRQEALLATQKAEEKRLIAERDLLLEQERLRREQEAHEGEE